GTARSVPQASEVNRVAAAQQPNRPETDSRAASQLRHLRGNAIAWSIPQAIAERSRAASQLRHLRGNAIAWSIPQAIAKRSRAASRRRAKSTDRLDLHRDAVRHGDARERLCHLA